VNSGDAALAADSMAWALRDARVAAQVDGELSRAAAAAVFQSARDSARPVLRESADASRAEFDGLRLGNSL
jgi:hypothetical protein